MKIRNPYADKGNRSKLVSKKIVCVKYNELLDNLELETDSIDSILESLQNQGFITTVNIEGETGYCLTESGEEYTEDWFRSLDLDVDNVSIEHLVEMLESTAPPDRQN